MTELTYDDVRKILAIIEDSTVEELHVELGDFKLDVRRHSGAVAAATTSAPPLPAPSASSAPRSHVQRVEPELASGQFAVVAPMLGTFYRRPAPDAAPFVEVGSHVAPGDPVGIIEVMKLMNTIVAQSPGRVAEILVDNATMVEFGQKLIVLDPL